MYGVQKCKSADIKPVWFGIASISYLQCCQAELSSTVVKQGCQAKLSSKVIKIVKQSCQSTCTQTMFVSVIA